MMKFVFKIDDMEAALIPSTIDNFMSNSSTSTQRIVLDKGERKGE